MKKFILSFIGLLGRIIYLPFMAFYIPTGEDKGAIVGVVITKDMGLIKHLAEYRKDEPFKP